MCHAYVRTYLKLGNSYGWIGINLEAFRLWLKNLHFMNELCMFLRNCSLPNAIYKFIFTKSLTIDLFFQYRDSIPFHLSPDVVYGHTCSAKLQTSGK